MQKTFLLEVSNLSYIVDRRQILQSVNLMLGPHHIVGLVGMNGAGKTTMLNLLAGLLNPDNGSIRLNGLVVNENPDVRQQLIGFLPDPLPLYPEFTVMEYLHFIAEIHAISPSKIPQRLRSVISALDLKSFFKQKMATLSKGQCQRVGLAQAILHAPQLILLDEPTNGLDPLQKSAFLDLVVQLKRSTTLVVSSHDLHEIKDVCDLIWLLHDGEITEHSIAEMDSLFANFSHISHFRRQRTEEGNLHVMDTHQA